MSSASAALRAAVHKTLSQNAGLKSLLGGARIYDAAPRAVPFPCVTLGEMRTTNNAAGDEPGEEHLLTLHAWSREGGHREAHLVADALVDILDDAPLAVSGHRLVNLRFTVADVKRESDGRTHRALVRFRAVTEPATP